MADPKPTGPTMRALVEDPALMNALTEFIQAFGGTIVNIKRYPEGSATVQMALERCRINAATLFTAVDSFTLTEAEKRILVDNEPLGEKLQERAFVRTFVDSMVVRAIRSITFRKEMTDAELLAFLRVMGDRPDDLRKQGPLEAQLGKAGVRNIVLDEKVFVALIKGQTIADIADLERIEALSKGQLDPSQVNDGIFLSFVLSKIPLDSLHIPMERIEELKKRIGYDQLKNADDFDFQKVGALITAALEDWSGADKVEAAQNEQAESGKRPKITPEDQVDKIVKSFEEISESIFKFKQPEVRAKLVNDFLRVVVNFKEITLAKILSTRIEMPRDFDLKFQILQSISQKKRSAVIDQLLLKYQRAFDGMRAEDFEINPEEVAESENVLKRILVLAKRQERTDLAEKAQRAIGMARIISKETATPAGMIVLKMKRLFSRSLEYLLQDEFLDDFPEFARYLCDTGRADLVRKVLERAAQNLQSAEQAVRLSAVQALVRMHQTFIDLGRGDLLGEGYLLLAKQIKTETEMVVFARILAAIVADYQKVLELRDLGVANNILRLLMRLRDEAAGAAQKQIFEQAVAKLTGPENLTDALFDSVQSEDERESEAAARLLSAFAPEPVIRRLLEILAKSEDRRIRKKCVTLVTRYGEIARDSVARRFAPDNPWYFNRNLVNILADIGDASSVGPIVGFLRHSEDRLRKATIAALTRIGGPEAAQALAECFDDQSLETQTALIQYFAKDKNAAAASRFITRLQDKSFLDDNEPLAIQMMHALGEIGDPAARDVLQSFLKRAGGLKSMFTKQSEMLLAAAISALGRLGDKASADGIKKFAHHSNADVARAAQQSLRLLQGGQA